MSLHARVMATNDEMAQAISATKKELVAEERELTKALSAATSALARRLGRIASALDRIDQIEAMMTMYARGTPVGEENKEEVSEEDSVEAPEVSPERTPALHGSTASPSHPPGTAQGNAPEA